jgi:hypothetical protein
MPGGTGKNKEKLESERSVYGLKCEPENLEYEAGLLTCPPRHSIIIQEVLGRTNSLLTFDNTRTV